MRRILSTAVVLAASAVTVATAAIPADADTGPTDYSQYVSISGPQGLTVGGDWGVWTLQAKNPTDTVDTQDHLLFEAHTTTDPGQLQLEYRAGTSGDWIPAAGTWKNKSTNPSFPGYAVTLDLAGALTIEPHSALTYEIRARRVATSTETDPSALSFNAYLEPAADEQTGAYTAAVGVDVETLGLTTTISGLPTTIPADGRSRLFQVHITAENQADWHIPSASFFLWQGDTYGSMSGPSSCDAEIDVYDPVHHRWQKVGMDAAGLEHETVDLAHWATGPAWDRTLDARITLGAKFRTGSGSKIGFGYFPGSGEPDDFWGTQKLTAEPVAGAPACVSPSSGAPAGTASPSASASAAPTTPAASPTSSATPIATGSAPAGTPAPTASPSAGGTLAATGGGSDTGLLGGIGAALVVLGGGAVAVLRRRGRRA